MTQLEQLKTKLATRYIHTYQDYPPCKYGHLNCSLTQFDDTCIDELCGKIETLEQETHEN